MQMIFDPLFSRYQRKPRSEVEEQDDLPGASLLASVSDCGHPLSQKGGGRLGRGN